MIVTILLSSALSQVSPTVAPPAPVQTVEQATLTLADLASLADGEQIRFGHLELARAPRGQLEILLSADQQRALIRRRVPGLSFKLKVVGDILWRSVASATPVAYQFAGGKCSAAARAIRAGALLSRDAITQAPCRDDDNPTSAIRSPILGRDARTRQTVAARDIAAGDYLGRLRVESLPQVVPGQRLTLITHDGPVTVEREVIAMQPAMAGRRLFARTDDGKLVVARLAAPEEAEKEAR